MLNYLSCLCSNFDRFFAFVALLLHTAIRVPQISCVRMYQQPGQQPQYPPGYQPQYPQQGYAQPGYQAPAYQQVCDGFFASCAVNVTLLFVVCVRATLLSSHIRRLTSPSSRPPSTVPRSLSKRRRCTRKRCARMICFIRKLKLTVLCAVRSSRSPPSPPLKLKRRRRPTLLWSAAAENRVSKATNAAMSSGACCSTCTCWL